MFEKSFNCEYFKIAVNSEFFFISLIKVCKFRPLSRFMIFHSLKFDFCYSRLMWKKLNSFKWLFWYVYIHFIDQINYHFYKRNLAWVCIFTFSVIEIKKFCQKVNIFWFLMILKLIFQKNEGEKKGFSEHLWEFLLILTYKYLWWRELRVPKRKSWARKKVIIFHHLFMDSLKVFVKTYPSRKIFKRWSRY